MRLFIDFQMMDRTFRLRLWIPKNYGPIDYFVMTWKVLLRHISHLCRPALVVTCSFCCDIVSCSLLEYFHDIVLLKLSSLCRDMSVLCCDIKTLLQHNLSFSIASEFYRDINLFVAAKLLVFHPCSILRHKFEMSQHKIHCRDNLLLSPLQLLSRHSFLLLRHNSLPLALHFVATFFAMLRHTFVVLLNLCSHNNFFCRDRVSYYCMGLLLR